MPTAILVRRCVHGLTAKKYQLIATDVAEVDVTVPAEVRAFADANRPDVIINCTGFNDEDGCETDPDRAYRVNALAPPQPGPCRRCAGGQDGAVLHR